MLKYLALLLTGVALSGCAFHHQPFVAYLDKGHAVADTAIFALSPQEGAVAEIPRVDGMRTSCWQAGCPFWVRVLPGTHSFMFDYKIYSGNQIISLREPQEIVVESMLPGHVYKAELTSFKGKLRVNVVDLGEKPDYGIAMGLQGVNRKTYPASFE